MITRDRLIAGAAVLVLVLVAFGSSALADGGALPQGDPTGGWAQVLTWPAVVMALGSGIIAKGFPAVTLTVPQVTVTHQLDPESRAKIDAFIDRADELVKSGVALKISGQIEAGDKTLSVARRVSKGANGE